MIIYVYVVYDLCNLHIQPSNPSSILSDCIPFHFNVFHNFSQGTHVWIPWAALDFSFKLFRALRDFTYFVQEDLGWNPGGLNFIIFILVLYLCISHPCPRIQVWIPPPSICSFSFNLKVFSTCPSLNPLSHPILFFIFYFKD